MARGTVNLQPLPPKHLGKYLAGGEVLYVETRATKLFYFPGPIVALLIMLVLDYFVAAARYGWPSVAGVTHLFTRLSTPFLTDVLYLFLFLTLLVLIWLGVRAIRWIRTVYAVSNHRIIIKRGIASRDIDDIPMNQIRGVDVHQTIGQRILGYGTVRVSAETGTSRSIGNEDWRGIPKPFQVQRTIETVMQNPAGPTGTYAQPPTVVIAPPPVYQQPPYQPPR